MIKESDYYAENEGCTFEFCKSCPLYECELVGEYESFKKERSALDDESYINYTCLNKDSFSYQRQDGQDDIPCYMNSDYVIPIECGKKTVKDGIGDHYKIDFKSKGYFDDEYFDPPNDKWGMKTEIVWEIQENVEARWSPKQPVFISAPTGQGKNYFIEQTLIPYVRNLNHQYKAEFKVLILSNRLALKEQITRHLDEESSLENGEGKIYSKDDYVDVMTYQSVINSYSTLRNIQIGGNEKSRYLFVVCDEAHFFTSDAMFNPNTGAILEIITGLFDDAIRIYMSATPYECLKYIIQYEKWNKENDFRMIFYHFKRDYSFLDINTYSDIRELYPEIINSVIDQRKKWIIFIDDIEKCKKIKQELEKTGKELNKPLKNEMRKNEIIYDVNTDSKKDPIYQRIVAEEKLGMNTSILISTSVLDNGINLNDIDCIVVSDMEKSKCLQMIGRARKSKKSSQKTLYIKKFDRQYVQRRIGYLEKQKEAYHLFDLAYTEDIVKEIFIPNENGEKHVYNFLNKYYDRNINDWEDAKHWFARLASAPNSLYYNEIARDLLNELIMKYNNIINEMEYEYDQLDPALSEKEREKQVGMMYLKYQLSWFGKKYNPENDVTGVRTEKAKKKLLELLETLATSGKELREENLKDFRSSFISLYDEAFGKSDPNSRQYGVKKMNDLLQRQKIGYMITGPAQKGPWTIIRYEK